ncbi:unnamed protein product [Meloidogyne enterolobii]|uniref:Uncharacterized protein n=3 Tax=Meloidogyne enterolobii TaxID=390850 RepID=A0ACB1B924_MELEN
MSSSLNVENNQNNSTAPPGWNDPPPTINQSNLNSRTNLHKLRRPVDPSIQGSNFNTPEKDFSLSPNNNSHFHQSRSFPQLTKPELVQGLGTHPGSAFTPTSAGSLLSSANCSSPSMSMRHFTDTSHGTIPPPPVILPAPHSQLNIQQLAANSSQSMAPNLPQPLPPFLQSIPTADLSATAILSHPNQQSCAPPFYHPVINGQIDLLNQQQIVSEMPSITTIMTGEEATTQSIGQQPMIFSPPNIVPQCRPTTQPIPTDYRTPIKAAGDVSLSGPQLAAFLTKAALLLPQVFKTFNLFLNLFKGPMCEGILLRIKQFEELVLSRQISEPCLKKLNFVVDALDRHVYDEAGQFFEQMLVNYADDCAIGGWAHGIRLLIHELRKTQSPNIRSHSAGTRNH